MVPTVCTSFMTFEKLKVSVIMPAFNAEMFIAESIQSVLSQSYKNLELIVVDDGSSDSTVSIVKSFLASDARIKLIIQKNSGRPSIARNKGILSSTGEYISFLDSDDLWHYDRVKKMVEGIDLHDDWVATFHDLKLIDAAGNDLEQIYLADINFLSRAQPYIVQFKDNFWECDKLFYKFMSLNFAAIHTQSIMIARNRLPKDFIKFDQSFTICEDTDLWIRIAMKGKIGFLNQILSSYRQHALSITRNQIQFVSQTIAFHEHNLCRIKNGLSQPEINQYRKKIANYMRTLGYLQYDKYNLYYARKQYLKAFLTYPSLIDLISLGKTLLPLDIIKKLRSHQNS